MNTNLVTILLIGVFVMPILIGVLNPFAGNIQHCLFASFRRLEFMMELILSVYLTKVIFSGHENGLLMGFYAMIPPLRESVINQDIWAYLIAVFILLFFIYSVLQLAKLPLYRFFLIPLSNSVSAKFNAMNVVIKRMLGGLGQVPKSIFLVLVFSLLLNLYSGYAKNTSLGDYINHSATYRFVDNNILQPILDSSLANEIPVLFNHSFVNAVESTSLHKITAITYFNGVTLKEAVKSNEQIDDLAHQIIGAETSDSVKAYLIYEWVSANLEYDYDKVQTLDQNAFAVSSGSLAAYETGNGVCFDYSCLYVSMCRAVGLNVRLIAGDGYSGDVRSDHAWNQVFDSDENRWLNVDTTYGSTGSNYFDNTNFFDDHANSIIMGEW